jgi:hypothetical protein
MNWTDLLKAEIDHTYKASFGLLELVDEKSLGWKPATGGNWMTTGQLLRHMTEACGLCCRGFVEGKWPMQEGFAPEDMLPSAEKMKSVKSVAEARTLLEADREVALAMVAKAGEEDLGGKSVAAPWNPEPRLLGQQLLQMVLHLGQHKGQLFYYLKLQGKPVHTGHLWGM